MSVRSIARALAAVVALAGPLACATAEDAPTTTVTGLVDVYTQASLSHPSSGTLLTGRSFDVRHSSFALSLAEINITRSTTAALPFGFTATLTAGKTADLVHATEPGSATNYKLLQQLYGTWAGGGAHPVTIDAGKYVTMMGMEVIESPLNDNYSRGLLFNYAIPFYHMGIRATTALSSNLTGQLHLVNGWNNVEDDNGGKSLGVQLNYKPTAASNVILNWMGGPEGAGAALARNLDVQVVDVVATIGLTPKVKIGANLDYASATRSAGGGGHWNGLALYGRYQARENCAVAARFEGFDDSDGLRTGTPQTLHSSTLTLEHAQKGGGLTRLEFRYDHAGTAFFPSSSGTSGKQHTITIGQTVKF
jgi:hypothetical protein